MDTRTKIVTPELAEQAARRSRANGTPVRVVTGFFDPLLAAHARRLQEIARRGGVLIVIVTDPARPILAGPARAELVAALAVVDYVVLADRPIPEILRRVEADEVIRAEAEDERRTLELMRHVHSRSQPAPKC